MSLWPFYEFWKFYNFFFYFLNFFFLNSDFKPSLWQLPSLWRQPNLNWLINSHGNPQGQSHIFHKALPSIGLAISLKKVSSNISHKAQVRYNCDCTNYCAELTSNFRSMEVRRYLDLRVARSTSVLFEVSMSNLPGHSCSCAPHMRKVNQGTSGKRSPRTLPSKHNVVLWSEILP